MRALAVVLALALAGAAAAATPRGTARPDRIDAVNGVRETIRCGAGRDVVVADRTDVVARDCEVLSRRIAVDGTTTPGAQHRAIVEPSAASDGNTVVAVFQSGRFRDGGAAAIGWATSLDGGATWRSGLLPGPATGIRVSDPVVVRDRVHGVWLASLLVIDLKGTQIMVDRSSDGLVWTGPVVAATAPSSSVSTDEGVGLDKEWLTCDALPASPHTGACYLAYTDLVAHSLVVQTSQDGGVTWGQPAFFGPEGVGALPVVAPDGTLVVVYATADFGAIESVRSSDGGTTFSTPVHVADVLHRYTLLRTPPLPTGVATSQGVVVAWADCRLRSGCATNDILLSSSVDGATWSEPRAAPLAGDHATPALGGSGATLALLSFIRLGDACCRLGVQLATSRDGGATWSPPTRLDARPMQAAWLAKSLFGRTAVGFLGDYLAVAFVGDRPVPVFTAALEPVGENLRQDLYATTRLR